jgi:hypothetical protein
MPQEVRVRRTLVNTPTVDDPNRKVYQIMYTVGELPPAFVYVPEKGYTKEKETAAIKADLADRMGGAGGEITTI